MADNDNLYERTINDLVAKIDERMKPILDDKRMVNRLCEVAGLPLRYPDVEMERAGGALSFRRDQFFGKPLATVVREYLQQRGPSDRGGIGAATVNEIFDALISGGYKPETDDETNAKRGLRIALTKNSATFYRVPSGAYGLLEWYPNAKAVKGEDDSSSGKSSKASAAKQVARKAAAKRPRVQTKRGKAKPKKAAGPSLAPFILSAMADGKDWTLEQLRQEALARSISGVDISTKVNVFQGTLLALRTHKQVVSVGNGVWRIVNEATPPVDAGGVVHAFKGAA